MNNLAEQTGNDAGLRWLQLGWAKNGTVGANFQRENSKE